ncbi:MAG: hypothetical protein ACLFQL_05155 [Paracoccaceae bacterium]
MKPVTDPLALSIASFRFAGYALAAQIQIWTHMFQAGVTLASPPVARPAPAAERPAETARRQPAPARAKVVSASAVVPLPAGPGPRRQPSAPPSLPAPAGSAGKG